MLSVDGDADAAVEARILTEWNKFRQAVPLLTNWIYHWLRGDCTAVVCKVLCCM